MKFYRDGLGIPFKPTRYGDDSFEARVGDVRFLLHPDFDDSLRKARRGAGVLIHFWVRDADTSCAEIRQRGIAVDEDPENRPWGRHFSVGDPDGYRIHILGLAEGGDGEPPVRRHIVVAARCRALSHWSRLTAASPWDRAHRAAHHRTG
ncbi:MAG: VOC family protein [bacterium]